MQHTQQAKDTIDAIAGAAVLSGIVGFFTEFNAIFVGVAAIFGGVLSAIRILKYIRSWWNNRRGNDERQNSAP